MQEPTVFWKRHTGGKLWFDSMIKKIILPQIGLAHEQIKHNAIQGGPLCFENAIQGESLCFYYLIQNTGFHGGHTVQ